MRRTYRTLSLTALLTVAAMVGLLAQTTTPKLSFDTTDPVAATAGYGATLQVNAGPAATVSLTCVAGTGGAVTTCTTPLTVPPVKGDVFKLTLTNAGGTVQTTFTDPGTPVATNIRIVIIITVP